MLKYFTANSTRKYIDVLDKLVDQYNNSVHFSIKMSLVEAKIKIKFLEIFIKILG